MAFFEFDPILVISEWLRGIMLSWSFSEGITDVILKLLGAVVIGGFVLAMFILQTWLERKVAARIQDRIGPNRVGPRGLLQPIADAVKMITKEDTTPANADKLIFNIAPILSLGSVILVWGVIPFSALWFGADINVGVLYVAAVGSFGILSVLMAGWSSNNKFALIGAFRGVAQLISYEVPLLLTMILPVFLARSMNINDIVEAQAGFGWFIFYVPLGFLIYFISNMAEIGRAPFDLLEAESEIVAGYNVEYSGMKFGLFMASEFAHSFAAGALISVLFFGGWQPMGASPLLGTLVFFIKAFFFYFVIMWIRLTVPRIRIDHMMSMNWKFLVPLSLVLLMATPLLDYFVKDLGWIRMASHAGLNLGMFFIAFFIIANNVQKNKPQKVRFPERPLAVPPKEEGVV
jgi:NADH-quinone oxidoreductase subunit H